MKKRLLAGLMAATMITTAAVAQSSQALSPLVKAGWDWSFPQATQPAPYSGFVTWGEKRFDPAITVWGIHIKWAELNPAPGQYNWDLLKTKIQSAKQNGMRVGLHLTGVERTGVPDWVIKKYNPPVYDVPPLTATQPWRISLVAPWDPGVDKEFQELLKAFSATGIAQSEDVVYGYIHGISPSRGEELFLRKEDAQALEKISGLTPQVFADWLRRRTDAMLLGFKGVEYKLAWMSGGPVGPTPEYKKATENIWKYAIDHGTGIRGGAVDFMASPLDSPAWGSKLTPEGYCVVDDENPTIKEHRYRGDENEEYGKGWEWRFGKNSDEYRHRISSLRGLQMRQNFQFVSPETLKVNPEINEYVRLTQGRTRDEAPDAWAYLRETKVSGNRTFKNIERWLIQRDVEGSRSVADLPIERPGINETASKMQKDFDGRRTDLANKQDGLSFQLDKVFWAKPAPATIKVTFTDQAAAKWRLITTNSKGEKVQSPIVENTGDKERKTATFSIEELAANGGFEGAMDFRLASEGPGDLYVTMVRVIK